MLWTAAFSSSAAEIRAVRILTGEDNSFVRQTATSLADMLKQTDPALDVEIAAASSAAGSSETEGRRLVVLIGERAFTLADTGSAPVLAVVPQRVAAAEKKRMPLSMIYFEQPLARLFNLATLVTAEHGRKPPVLGIVVSPDAQRFVAPAETLANERKLALHIERVSSEDEVGRAIARVAVDANLLIAIPDAIVHTPNTVQSVLLVSYHAGVPVLGYSAAYLRAGAAVALYSTPQQLAQQAADAIGNYRASRSLSPAQWPRYYTVGINSTVMRSLGIDSPTGDVLEKKLETMRE